MLIAEFENSKKYFENIFQSTKEAIVVLGFDAKIIMANNSATVLWSYTSEEMHNLDASLLIESDEFQEWLEKLKLYSQHKDLTKLHLNEKEVIAFTKFGYKNPALINCSPLTDSNNIVYGGVFTATDLSERRYLEKAFWENEEKLRYLTSFAIDGILMMDGKGKISFWNKAATSIFGYTEEEVFGKDLHKLLAPSKYHSRFNTAFDQFIITGEGEAINKTLELSALRKSGEEFPIELSLSAIKINNKWNAIAIIRDISERKKAEQKIIESEAYYRTLIETSPDAIITSDVEGIIKFASKKANELFGTPGTEYVIGTSLFQWIDPEFHKKALERIAGIFSGTYRPGLNEYKLIKFNGSPITCEVSSSAFLNSEDNISGLLIVIHDISERKKAELELLKAKEKAEESDKLKASFIQNISHEIRTPMNALVGFSELLKDPDQSEYDKKIFTDHIIESTNQLLTVITDIVEISNIKTNQVKYMLNEVTPNDILKDISSVFSQKAAEKNLILIIENRVDNPELKVIADKTLLLKILNHLVTNALKFTARGIITIGCIPIKNRLRFFVKDSGIGIPHEFQARVFEPFYQVENSISRKYEGTGLGLAISRAYVELMGGEIRLKSETGSGSEFSFALPGICAGCKEEIITNIPKEWGIKTLLITEDDNNNYNLLERLLKETDIIILRGHNGAEAVEIVKSGRNIDLILMDLRMPVMDGYEATREIRKLNPDIPIVAQTAYADEAERGNTTEFSEYISKPFDKVQLLEVISKYLT